jgi:serine protease AprX
MVYLNFTTDNKTTNIGFNITKIKLGNFTLAVCNKVIAGYDFFNDDPDPLDDNGHGTHVSGIIAANGNIKGVAPGAKIIAVKVMSSGGGGSESDIIEGIQYCIDNKDKYNISIISLSIGGGIYSNYCDGEIVANATNNAYDQGLFVVAASGNGNSNSGVSNPACASKAISVGASYDYYGTNPKNWCNESANVSKITCYTNLLSSSNSSFFMPHIIAPGSMINSTVPFNSTELNDSSGYKVVEGTSMATPHVSGALALLIQRAKIFNDSYNIFGFIQCNINRLYYKI